MRAAALATLLLPLALSSPFYEPVSSNPSEWDPSHPPAAALLYPEHDRKGSSRLTEDKDSDDDNGTVWDLSSTELSAWQWPAYLTAAVNCNPNTIKTWTCGVNCERVGGMKVIISAGDNKKTPWWYVGVAGPTAVVAVKGTNTDSLKSLLNDVKFNKDHLDDVEVEIDGDKVDAFPNAGDAEAHKGFLEVFERIQPDMHPAIQTAFSMNATRILVVGHSLGASVGLLLAVYLQEQFPNVTVSARTFGAPRTGDGDFADYVDQTMGNRSLFMVNYDDMVPHLPPKALNFVHSSGEVWSKRNDSDWVWCRGQDNDDCSDSVDGDFSSLHDGPYAQVYMDCTQMKGKASSTAPQLKTFNWTDTGLSNSGQ